MSKLLNGAATAPKVQVLESEYRGYAPTVEVPAVEVHSEDPPKKFTSG